MRKLLPYIVFYNRTSTIALRFRFNLFAIYFLYYDDSITYYYYFFDEIIIVIVILKEKILLLLLFIKKFKTDFFFGSKIWELKLI